MEVLLQKDVDKLGTVGDVVEVADGYARNYLLPQQIAVPVTEENLRQMSKQREARQEREQEELARVRHQAEALEGFVCRIPARATEAGHLFGSVGPQQIADHLAASGFEGVRAANIALQRHLEEIGEYEVEVMLHPKVRTNITVHVRPENDAADEEQ